MSTPPEDPYAPPPQEPGGQPHGQPQYGQPQYGQSPYGQPQYGQPQYGQPQYGPPPHGPYGYGQAPLPPGAVRPLQMGNRVLAFIIDILIVGVPFAIIYGIVVGTSSPGAAAGVAFLLAIAGIGYFVYFIGSTGQTVGKQAMGVKVVDAQTGQAIGYGRAFGRYLVQALCNLLCYAGLWSAFLDSSSGRYQGWHDKALNTQVISVK